jgi:flagellar biosynthesis protein FlhG
MAGREWSMVKRPSDQAAGLRRMFRAARAHIVAVVGGSAGAGATTCAVNLAAALRRHGRRVLLIDTAERMTRELDVLAAGHHVHAAPALDATADIVLIDTNANGQERSLLTEAAQDVIVVVSPGASSITGGYAAIKHMHRTHGRKRFQLLVNRAEDEFTARRVQKNMAHVARQHLDVRVEYMGAIPRDPALSVSAGRSLTVVDTAPMAAASRAFCERSAALLRLSAPQNDSSRPDNFKQRAICGSRLAAASAGV